MFHGSTMRTLTKPLTISLAIFYAVEFALFWGSGAPFTVQPDTQEQEKSQYKKEENSLTVEPVDCCEGE